jgi:hypothetical protein
LASTAADASLPLTTTFNIPDCIFQILIAHTEQAIVTKGQTWKFVTTHHRGIDNDLWCQLSVLCNAAAVCRGFLVSSLTVLRRVQHRHNMAQPRAMPMPVISPPQRTWLDGVRTQSMALFETTAGGDGSGIYAIDTLRLHSETNPDLVQRLLSDLVPSVTNHSLPAGYINFELIWDEVRRYFHPVWYANWTFDAAITVMNNSLLPQGYYFFPPAIASMLFEAPCSARLRHLDPLRQIRSPAPVVRRYKAAGPNNLSRCALFENVYGNHWRTHVFLLDQNPVLIKLMDSLALPPTSQIRKWDGLDRMARRLYTNVVALLNLEAASRSPTHRPIVHEGLILADCVFIQVGAGLCSHSTAPPLHSSYPPPTHCVTCR